MGEETSMIITRGFGGGNFILRGFMPFWVKVTRALRRYAGGIGAWYRPLRKKVKAFKPLVPLLDIIKSISVFNCPYCEFSVANLNLIDLAGHIREAHPDKLVGISKVITQVASNGRYSDIEALILAPEDKAPKQYNKKPLIAQETISVRVKKGSAYERTRKL